jgi:surface protein
MMNRKTIYLALLLTLPLCLAGQGRGAWWRAVSSQAEAVNVDTSFITRWNLATAGSGATQLSFGVAVAGTVGYQWEEVSPGSASGSGTFSASPLTITGLPSGAVVRVKINPTNFRRIIINNGTDRSRLVNIENWGSTAWTSMEQAFYGCNNLQASITATDSPTLGAISISQMFRACSLFNSDISGWDVSAVTNLSYIFLSAPAFNQDISGWDVSNVTNMEQVFNFATAFNQPIGVWDVRKATTLRAILQNTTAFNQNIGSWRPVSCTNFEFFMTDKTPAIFSASNLAAIYSGWTDSLLQASRTITFGTATYASSGAAGRAFLARTAATVSVSGTANAGGLIEVTTSAAHGLTTGFKVYIFGVGGTTEANGPWIVTVTGASTFTLDGSTYANAWTSGGTVRTGWGWSVTDGGPE